MIHIRFQTDDGLVVRNQRGLELADPGGGPALSEEVRGVLEARGWGDEELEALMEPREPSPDVEALLDEMPSCLEELQEQNDDG